jgi:hypothetical protein
VARQERSVAPVKQPTVAAIVRDRYSLNSAGFTNIEYDAPAVFWAFGKGRCLQNRSDTS